MSFRDFKDKEDFKNFFLGLLQTEKTDKKHLSLLLNLYIRYNHNLMERSNGKNFQSNFFTKRYSQLIESWFNAKNHFCKKGKEFLRNLQKKNINFLLKFELPENLQNIDWLFAEGNLNILFNRENLFIGMIGTRSPKGDYKRIIHTVIAAFKRQNPVIVSGLARGIDSAAHKTAIDLKIPTISVLGYGILHKYSTSNEYQFLRKNIPESGGLIISAYRPSELPRRKNFLERNELIVQLSNFIIPVQGTVPSGTFSTIVRAINKNKPVICIKNNWVNEICEYVHQSNYSKFFVFHAEKFNEKTVNELLLYLRSKELKPDTKIHTDSVRNSIKLF